MVNGAAVEDAVARARRLPALRVGLHLVLVDGRPLLPADAVPDLVDGDGRLHNDLARAGRNLFFRPAARRQLAAEITAQFEAYRATGLPLDHVNGHHHFHVHPTVTGQLLVIGRRYAMRAVRVPLEPADLLRRIEPSANHRGDWRIGPWARLLRARLRRHGLLAPARVFGLAWSGAMTEARIAALLQRLPAGITEMYLHPALTNQFAGASAGYDHAQELAALLAAGTKTLVRASGATLGGFSDACLQ
jgi:chitin disaccharide deacetylase